MDLCQARLQRPFQVDRTCPGTTDTSHLPGTAWQDVCSLTAGSTAGASLKANTNPDVPTVEETIPDSTIPLPTAPAAWSPPPPTTGVPSASPVARAAEAEIRPLTSADS